MKWNVRLRNFYQTISLIRRCMCVTMTPFHNCNKAALPPNPHFTPLCKILVYKATKPLAVVGMENWRMWDIIGNPGHYSLPLYFFSEISVLYYCTCSNMVIISVIQCKQWQPTSLVACYFQVRILTFDQNKIKLHFELIFLLLPNIWDFPPPLAISLLLSN